ncbi:hypothetical protein J6590_065256 [Homalodisca vitripennis]|nr:hypothetical protein J6590_065256 [Homalodisca vitripennis]
MMCTLHSDKELYGNIQFELAACALLLFELSGKVSLPLTLEDVSKPGRDQSPVTSTSSETSPKNISWCPLIQECLTRPVKVLLSKLDINEQKILRRVDDRESDTDSNSERKVSQGKAKSSKETCEKDQTNNSTSIAALSNSPRSNEAGLEKNSKECRSQSLYKGERKRIF